MYQHRSSVDIVAKPTEYTKEWGLENIMHHGSGVQTGSQCLFFLSLLGQSPLLQDHSVAAKHAASSSAPASGELMSIRMQKKLE